MPAKLVLDLVHQSLTTLGVLPFTPIQLSRSKKSLLLLPDEDPTISVTLVVYYAVQMSDPTEVN